MNILEQIKEAGVCGCGGAGFPTHIKFDTQAEYLIVNGVECEPLLKTDRHVMKTHADEVIYAITKMGEHLHAQKLVLALKKEYAEEIEALKNALDNSKFMIELFLLESFYPAGDEHVLIYEVTGRTIPQGGLPKDVGVVVSNVSTMKAIFDALQGKAFTGRYLTVTGNVKKSTVTYAEIGMPLKELISAAEPIDQQYSVIIGGPMMGNILQKEEIENMVVEKTTSGLIIIDDKSKMIMHKQRSVGSMIRMAKSACIQCSNCTELCPRYLLGHNIRPHKIMRIMAYNTEIEEILGHVDVKNSLNCSECGVCEWYACPMGLQPRRINQLLKRILKQQGESLEKLNVPPAAIEERKYRKVPTKRLSARLELGNINGKVGGQL